MSGTRDVINTSNGSREHKQRLKKRGTTTMTSTNCKPPSLSELVDRYRSGDEDAAVAIWRRYEERIAQYAQRKIDPAFRRRFDADDIALMTLESVLMGIRAGRYVVNECGTLWNLCAFKATRNIKRQVQHHTHGKRDVHRESPVQPEDLAPEAAPAEPSPQDTLALAAEVARIQTLLGPDDFRLYELWLEGKTSSQIADLLNSSRSTVQRRKKQILARLQTLRIS